MSVRSLKQRLRNLLLPSRLMADLEAIRMGQGKILAELNREKMSRSLRDYEFGVYSQWGEDGILQKLVADIPIQNATFIEFGVEDFSESNCRFLMANNHWRGYVIDGSEKWIASLLRSNWLWKHDLRARCATLTTDNINDVLAGSGFDSDIGVLSIDVDGIDYWLLEAITDFAPRILIVEYNSLFGSTRRISVPYDASFSRRHKHYSDLYYGASLPALVYLAGQKGYTLVGTESAGVNAFFVRNDLVERCAFATSVEVAFTESPVRQSRDQRGRLSYLDRAASLDAIRGLPVVNVETGATEQL